MYAKQPYHAFTSTRRREIAKNSFLEAVVGMTTISSQKPIVSVNARNALNYTIFASSGAGGGRAEVQVLVFTKAGK